MSLNPDLIRARCAEIDAALIRLDELRRLPRETFLSSQDTLQDPMIVLRSAPHKRGFGSWVHGEPFD